MNRSDLQVIVLHINALCSELLEIEPLLTAAVRDSADGYPRASFWEGSPSSECDEDGTPLPQHSDPTARAVLARNEGQSGQVSASRRQVLSALVGARRTLESARGRALKVLTPPEEPPAPKPEDLCSNCLSYGANSPVGSEAQHVQRAKRWGRSRIHPDLCDWCASFLESHGRRPPKVLVVKHKDGQRIYDRDVREAMSR